MNSPYKRTNHFRSVQLKAAIAVASSGNNNDPLATVTSYLMTKSRNFDNQLIRELAELFF